MPNPVLYFSPNRCAFPLANTWWNCGLTRSGQSVLLRGLISQHLPHGLCKSGILTALLFHKRIKITAAVVCGWSLQKSHYFPGHNLFVPSCHICWWSMSQWSVGHNDRFRGCDWCSCPFCSPIGLEGTRCSWLVGRVIGRRQLFVQFLTANLGITVSLLCSFKHPTSQSNHTSIWTHSTGLSWTHHKPRIASITQCEAPKDSGSQQYIKKQPNNWIMNRVQNRDQKTGRHSRRQTSSAKAFGAYYDRNELEVVSIPLVQLHLLHLYPNS